MSAYLCHQTCMLFLTVIQFVDEFLLVTKECSNFLVGDIIRSNAKNVKLDVLGVFGSVCWHEHPLLFVDMKYGEWLVMYYLCTNLAFSFRILTTSHAAIDK